MKTFAKYIYLIVLAVVIVFMAACTSDSITSEQPIPTDDADLLLLRIATNVTTRARTTEWADANAQDEEMMNLWVVLVTNTSGGSVVKCFACRPSAGAEREVDEVGRIARGAYTVYSFANISVANVCTLLGLTAPSTTTISNTPIEIAVTGTVNHTNALAATATINGNNFNSSAADNGFGEMGIPMSNVQTTAATDSQKDLIVVRMLAKMQINIKNETGAETTVQSLTISDITSNATNNLKLLPSLSYPNDMDAHHQDIRPNLSSSATTADLTVSVNKTIANNATETLSFYINESATPTNAESLFYLTLKMSDTEYRYALIISNNAANEWNYIARNDYRIIPIVLDDYKLELIPYDFPPIGVYPVSVREIENELYEMTFHDYGHFHLVPKVTKISNSSTVAYSSDATPSGTAWTLNTDFAGSWKTAATKGGAWLDADGITSNGFYLNQTATTDGDDAGGAPVWYVNTSSPQWDPAGGSNYNPFIFGYIADPGDTWWSTTPRTDKQIYHEFRVKLYVGGTYRRDLLYRFYMTLSKDQMLGTRGQASRHYHGH